MSREGDRYSRVEYRRLIAWPERIRREAPFLESNLAGGPSRRLLDLGCGTGEHARFLVSQGFEVVGVDASESMIAAALDQALPAGLEFVLGDVREVDRLTAGSFGGALCLGNMLPHLDRPDDLERTFVALRRRLAPSAPLVLQVLNYERIFARQVRALPVNLRPDEGDSEIVFLRLMKADPDSGRVRFFPSTLVLSPGQDPPLSIRASKEVSLRGWRPGEIEEALERSGFARRRLFGAFDESPFDLLDSHDLIVVAR